MKTVICPFSGDPITYGHIDIIQRSAQIFDHVIAAIGINPLKQYLFNIDERVQMAKKALGHLKNVQVNYYEGLLADFASLNGTHIIVRGLRNAEDFTYEWTIHQINESIDHEIETFWLPCRPQNGPISSSAVKNLWQSGKGVSDMVPPVVIDMLQHKTA